MVKPIMAYLVTHFRKVKPGGLGAMANHNSRFNVYDDSGGLRPNPPRWIKNLDRARFNEGQEGRRDDSTGKRRAHVIEEAGLKRKPQKNAAEAVEAVFSASPDHFKDPYAWKAFFKDCRNWIDDRFGHENVLQWNEHFDEKTPHMHVLMVPIVRDIERGNKYSSTDFLGGPDGLHEIHDHLFEKVGKKYKLDRGIDGSNARHTDQDEWKRELAKKERSLAEEKKELEEKERSLAGQKEAFKGILEKNGVAALMSENKNLKAEVQNLKKALAVYAWNITASSLPAQQKRTREHRPDLKEILDQDRKNTQGNSLRR
jgi:hypothetical protein